MHTERKSDQSFLSIKLAYSQQSLQEAKMNKKHLSSIANHVLNKCADLNNETVALMNKLNTTIERPFYISSIETFIIRILPYKTLGTTVDDLVLEFEAEWKPEMSHYSRKLVEYCSSKALTNICCYLEEKIADGSFSRLTFDMMLAHEKPSAEHEKLQHTEAIAKESEDNALGMGGKEQEDIPLFYSDIMPLLVDDKSSVGQDSFVWLGSLVPLPVDVVNGRFTFETLTSTTAHRLHFPAYDKYLKEIEKNTLSVSGYNAMNCLLLNLFNTNEYNHLAFSISRCVKYLQKQAKPTGVELAHDEFILHVDGTARTQRVVRHIGGTSWPGRLTLTNYALYFEASGVISYEDALKIDISKDTDHSMKRAATGPWGAPLFDKALIYESSQLPDSVVLEFPEMTSSTRREHWLSLIKEVILLHQFLLKHKDMITPLQAWEMQARTILAVMRLHAAREMLRIAPPVPTSFLIFSLFDELPKGDYVVEELANTLKQVNSINPCNASSVLRTLNLSDPFVSPFDSKEATEEASCDQAEKIPLIENTKTPSLEDTNTSPLADTDMPSSATDISPSMGADISSLEATISQVREKTKEQNIARATVERIKDEGIGESFAVLLELLRPFKGMVAWFQEVLTWERPGKTLLVLFAILAITYKEWIGQAIAAFLVWVAVNMYEAKQQRLHEQVTEIVVYTGSDQTTVESIVSAQHGMKSAHDMVKMANIAILKMKSILISKAPKHTKQVMIMMIVSAIFLAVIPFKFIIMGSVISLFIMNLKLGKRTQSNQGSNRRLQEWWDSIPAIPIRTVDKTQ